MRALVLLLALGGCAARPIASRGASADAGSADAVAEASLRGIGCGRDRVTGAELCSGISACPALLVDPDALPGCGFVPGKMSLACVCDDELCPIGTPATCAEASALLEETTLLGVCARAAEGACVRAR